MKHLFSLLIGASIMSQTINAKEIQIDIHNVDIHKTGQILVMLYAEQGFPKDHSAALTIHTLRPETPTLSTIFKDVPEEFAVKILHDENKSGTVTKNWTGIFPAEGLGFSNGAKLRFGPPNFSKAKLTLAATSSPLIIEMIYP